MKLDDKVEPTGRMKPVFEDMPLSEAEIKNYIIRRIRALQEDDPVLLQVITRHDKEIEEMEAAMIVDEEALRRIRFNI